MSDLLRKRKNRLRIMANLKRRNRKRSYLEKMMEGFINN